MQFSEKIFGGKKIKIGYSLIKPVVLFLSLSAPAVLFAFTGRGWISVIAIVFVLFLFGKVDTLLSYLIKDDQHLPKVNKLSSVDVRYFVN